MMNGPTFNKWETTHNVSEQSQILLPLSNFWGTGPCTCIQLGSSSPFRKMQKPQIIKFLNLNTGYRHSRYHAVCRSKTNNFFVIFKAYREETSLQGTHLLIDQCVTKNSLCIIIVNGAFPICCHTCAFMQKKSTHAVQCHKVIVHKKIFGSGALIEHFSLAVCNYHCYPTH